ncbi:spore cortex biosynthesis protein YabQ [Halobacillus litoralis]|uniref:spore cortex biosynthesis protein YabQ n=1 Tax=Halobacillus litoralis TaxID=45668 RepID=UPI001CD6FECD|nr:spore cortex biosynthesis protein YabQ [Halobacillus litoralis]MCA0972706.1 spore cortex biosynthesis protein YabQ [Halobacillus litoralis]
MTLTTQFVTILSMIGGGIIVGASLDMFERFFHKRNKRSWFEIFYQLGFWFCQAVLLFYILYLANYGELRVYVFIAVVCGFAMYRALFQTFFNKWLNRLIRWAVSVMNVLKKLGYYFIVWPVQTLITLIFSLLLVVYKILLKGILLLFIILFYPVRMIFNVLWRLLPKNAKNYLRYLKGKWDKIKNTIIKWKSKE